MNQVRSRFDKISNGAKKNFSGKFSQMFKRRVFRKLTAILLAFLFTISPLAPLLAAENNASGNENNAVIADNPPVSNSGNTIAPADISNGTNASSGNLPIKDSAVDLAEPQSVDSASQKNKNNGIAEATALAASQTSGYSSSGSSDPNNFDKTKLPQSETLTGALTYEYPINIPPGRNGLQPDLKLSYNSQAGEEGSIFGFGWNINILYIERINRKGTDKLYTENYFNSSLSGELVSIGGTSYSSKVDNGEFLKYEFNNNSWLVTDKQGTKYKFGYSVSSRQDNPSDLTKVFKWMLEEVRDTNDNFIRYEYFKDQGQIYPAKIYYTGSGATDGIFEVEFLREVRADAFTIYKTGFGVKTAYRINEIQAKINTNWTKKYSLAYAAGDNSVRSILSSVIESGRDELGNILTLPMMSFEYQNSNNKNWQLNSSWIFPVESQGYNMNKPLAFIDQDKRDQGVRIADVNGDGLPDLVKSAIEHFEYKPGVIGAATVDAIYINNGNGWILDTSWVMPIETKGNTNYVNNPPCVYRQRSIRSKRYWCANCGCERGWFARSG